MSFDMALLNLVGAGLGVVGSRAFAIPERTVRQTDPAELVGFLSREGCGRLLAGLAQDVARSLVTHYRADPDRVVRHLQQSASLLPDHALSGDPAVKSAWDKFGREARREVAAGSPDAAADGQHALCQELADAVLLQPRKIGLMTRAGLDDGLVRDILTAVLQPVLAKRTELSSFRLVLERFVEQSGRSKAHVAQGRAKASVVRAEPERLEAVRKKLADAAPRAGMPVAALLAFAQGVLTGRETDEELRRWVARKAEEYSELDGWLTRPADFDAAVGTLRAQAAAAMAAGRLDLADRLLAQAEDIDVAVARERIENEGLHLGRASETRVLRGKIEELRGEYRAAAAHQSAAAGYLAPDDARGKWRMMMRQAQLLARQAEEYGDIQSLQQAVALYQPCLHLRPRSASKDWAATQHMFGRLLLRLSEFRDDQQILSDAVEACRAAADELFGQREPMRWAQATSDYATALNSLGERTGDHVALTDALSAQRETLAVFSRATSPQDWAQAQIALAGTLLLIATRDGTWHRLAEAIAACRTALEVLDAGESPDQVAKARVRLAEALCLAARREGQPRNFIEAEQVLDALRSEGGSERVSRERTPLEWARLQAVRGTVEMELGRRSRSSERLGQAIETLETALDGLPPASMVLHFAAAHRDIGAAQEVLSQIERFAEPKLTQAVASYRAAVSALDRALYPRAWTNASLDLARALYLLGMETQIERWLSEAQVVEQAALEVVRTFGDTSFTAFVEDTIAERAEQIDRMKRSGSTRR